MKEGSVTFSKVFLCILVCCLNYFTTPHCYCVAAEDIVVEAEILVDGHQVRSNIISGDDDGGTRADPIAQLSEDPQWDPAGSN